MNHLGGHIWVTHTDEGLIAFLRHCGFNSLVDIGCGPGGNVILARSHGMDAVGIDGDPDLQKINQDHVNQLIIQHDYTLGALDPNPPLDYFDVGLSTEFLEHVEEQYIPNYMDTFQRCGLAIVTHALPGETGGHHHVNLQTEDWWIKKFDEYGFNFSDIATDNIRSVSTMKKGFIKKTGKVFINRKLKPTP